jgi:trimeric autotransporter adhesin
MKFATPVNPDQNPHDFQMEDLLVQLCSRRWQLAGQMTRVAICLGIVGYSVPAIAGNCVVGEGTPDPAIVPYISAEVANSSTVSANVTSAQNKADTLDDDWRAAISPQTSTAWASTATGSIANNAISLFTLNGVTVDVSLMNVTSGNDCRGVVNSSTASPELNSGILLQGNAPRPSSLPSNLASYWNENTGSSSNRNGVLFTFSRPVSAFGAWFGDLETRTDSNGTPAILRLLDAAGNRIGNDISITPNKISKNGAAFVDIIQTDCGSSIDGCGNNSTRWVGFVDTTARVKQALVIVGDQTTNTNGGNGEHISFLGANLVSAASTSPVISGTIFEDMNYSGGAGRPLSTATTVPRGGARVELYDSSGIFKAATVTNNNGFYNFGLINVAGGIVAGSSYTVRVVNNTVTSARSGSTSALIPVQTFRTNGLTNNIGIADINRVGGEAPQLMDAGDGSTTLSNLTTTTTKAQSIATITVGTASATGIDFGFNFDTIVNTNDSGQGSLRQFIENSNALGGEASLPGGYETSIFMIPNGAANPGQNTSYLHQLSPYKAAVINLTSALPDITGSKTKLDGATQTANITDTNSGTIGSIDKVGVDGFLVAKFNRPEVEISGKFTLKSTGSDNQIKNIAFNSHRILVNGNNSLVQDNLVGMQADGTNNATTAGVTLYGIEAGAGSDITIRHNYVRVNQSGIRRDGDGSRLTIESNEVDLPTSGQDLTYDGILLIGAGTDDKIQYNLSKNMKGGGIEVGFRNLKLTNILIENNTVFHNGYTTYGGTTPSTETMGVVAYALTTNSAVVFSKNIITENSGPGVVVMSAAGIKLTKNSIFANGASGNGSGLSIDLDATVRDPNSYGTAEGVTPNDGLVDITSPNNGIDYPILTSASLSGGTLTVKGYVGNIATGSTTFANATLEFFIADNDGNNNGKVFSSDAATVSRFHGEGKTYIGTCTADGNGLFGNTSSPCIFTNAGAIGLVNTKNITATATDSKGNTSEFSVGIGDPNLLLVKRITAINNLSRKTTGETLNGYEHFDAYDDNIITIPTQLTSTAPPKDTDKWPTPSNFLIGAVDGGYVKPQDSIEYTIYFLSAGDSTANNVLFCDRVPANVTFIPKAFNSVTSPITLDPTGLTGADRGIVVNIGNTIKSYTNIADADIAQYFPVGVEPSTVYSKIKCGGTNDNGAVVVNLGNLKSATGTLATDQANGAYGFVRFRGLVK